jgi:hypothetical protein
MAGRTRWAARLACPRSRVSQRWAPGELGSEQAKARGEQQASPFHGQDPRPIPACGASHRRCRWLEPAFGGLLGLRALLSSVDDPAAQGGLAERRAVALGYDRKQCVDDPMEGVDELVAFGR